MATSLWRKRVNRRVRRGRLRSVEHLSVLSSPSAFASLKRRQHCLPEIYNWLLLFLENGADYNWLCETLAGFSRNGDWAAFRLQVAFSGICQRRRKRKVSTCGYCPFCYMPSPYQKRVLNRCRRAIGKRWAVKKRKPQSTQRTAENPRESLRTLCALGVLCG